jgi:C4-dicarboxylate transporter DctQ subunit
MAVLPHDGGGRPSLVDRCGDALARLCLAIAALSLLAIVAINGANVLARYAFLSPFSWAEELMLFLMILSVFTGAVAITWRNMHIRIDTFVDLAPPAVGRVIRAVGAIASIGAIVTIAIASANIVFLLRQIDQRSDALELPSWIPQSFLTIGLAAIVLIIAVQTVRATLRRPAPDRAESDR